jgi:hypothetical protein
MTVHNYNTSTMYAATRLNQLHSRSCTYVMVKCFLTLVLPNQLPTLVLPKDNIRSIHIRSLPFWSPAAPLLAAPFPAVTNPTTYA